MAFNEFIQAESEAVLANEVERNLWSEQTRYSRIQLNQWDLLARDLSTDLDNNFDKLWANSQVNTTLARYEMYLLDKISGP